MKFAHLADLQLGCYQIAGKSSQEREQDFYDVFNAAIDESIKRGVDFVVCSGDIFHYPGSRSHPLQVGAYSTLKNAAIKLKANGINFYLTSGNHETPKYKAEAHPLTILNGYDNVEIAYSKNVYIPEHKVLLIPWIWGESLKDSDFQYEDVDVCVLHAPCDTFYEKIGSFNLGSRYFNMKKWKNAYPYIALGDWHTYHNEGNAYYPSSLERTSFGEAGNPTGGIFVTMENSVIIDVDYWHSPSREMQVITVTSDADKELQEILDNGDPENIYRIIIPSDLKVDNDLVYKLRSKFKFLRIDFTFSEEDNFNSQDSMKVFKKKTLTERWQTYCEVNNVDNSIYELCDDVIKGEINE